MQIEKKCLNCKESFQADIRYIKRGHAKFCSRRCSGKFNHPQKNKISNVTCAQCNIKFYKPLSKIKKSKSGLHFCNRKCKDTAQCIGGIAEIMPRHYNTGKGLYRYRKMALKRFGSICNRCKYDKNINALVVHHKDRNRSNNNISNLEVLCANCHLIEHLSDGGG